MAPLQSLGLQRTATALWIPSMLYLLGAAGGKLASTRKITINRAWNLSCFASTSSLLCSLACCAIALLHGSTLARKPEIESLAKLGAAHLSFRFDLVESLMLLLVSFLGWVIVDYSHAYMAGDLKEPAYVAHLMRTLAAVSLLVVTNNLIVFLAAWVFTSLSLHGLLTLYPNRQAAVIAAHKKFLASRLGDLTLLSGVLMLGAESGSFEMDKVVEYIARLHPVPTAVHVAAFLIVISAVIKCAQLPLHGWLIQVMEAPTPVSALLHAGVVNLGGFMLIRLAVIINSTPTAQALLVLLGSLTAIIASLVMTTRISIKVHLAWSTCAQMGFMLMECGLGLYGLAFLHLLAHSLYKAHAFLGSGGTVSQAKLKCIKPPHPPLSVPAMLGSGICGLLAASAGAMLWQHHAHVNTGTMLCITIAGLALAELFAAMISTRSMAASLLLIVLALGVSALYFGYDRIFQWAVPIPTSVIPQQRVLLTFSAGCFVLLYCLQTMVRLKPLGRVATWLYPWFYAGLYLDELFTRTTFRLWPANRISNVTPPRDATQPFEAEGVRP